VPYRPDGDFLQDDQLSQWDSEPEEAEGGGWWKWAVAVASLAIFGGVVWYAYTTGASGPSGPVRTVEADLTPYKVKPQNPGGEIIPDQDKLVFNEAVGRPEETEDMLGDVAEAPQSKPEPIAVRKFKPPVPAAKPAPPPAVEPAPGPEVAAVPPTPAAPTATAPVTTVPPAVAGAKPTPLVPGAATKPADGKAVDATQAEAKPAAPLPDTAAQPVTPQPVTPPPAPEAKAAAASGGKSPVVQLGAYASNAGAMESWGEVQRKQGSIVASLSPQVIKISVPGKGDLYRLVIGPFADRQSAVQVCTQLKAQGRDCLVNAN
jgi:cell division septation protein DedD